MAQFTFTGHETFNCKQSWLKKGVDFVSSQNKFSDESAVVSLGVGKNMVSSIRYWLKVFGITEREKDSEEKISDLGDFIFGSEGIDPYLEDVGTIWLLHYSLVKSHKASMYHLLFNDFRRKYPEFQKQQFISYVMNYCASNGGASVNQGTLEADFDTLMKNYLPPRGDDKEDVEDAYSRMFPDLGLISRFVMKEGDRRVEYFRLESGFRESLPPRILLYAILDVFPGQESITFDELLIGNNSPGQIFMLNREDLYNKIESLQTLYAKKITFTETAGIGNLQLKGLDKNEVLKKHYGN